MTWKIVKHKIQFAKKLAEWKRTPIMTWKNTKFELSLSEKELLPPIITWKTQNLNFRSSLQRSWLIGKCSWVVVGGSLACCVALCCVALCCIVLYCIVLCATDYRSALPCSNPDWRPIYNDEHLQRQAAVRIPDFKFTIYNLQFSQIYE